ncbi:MAG: sugar phosphate isomerase/epimerase [Planctomycetota bacterium]
MKLSLSVRIAESFHSKTTSEMSIEELIDTATSIGFSALCMRASQAGIETPRDVSEGIAQKIANAGLKVSMITGDVYVPQNDEHGPDGLRNITPFLDLAELFGSDLIRICMKQEEDIEFAQRASDEAHERGIRLAHQSHFGSLFETVDQSHDVLKRVGRENFGLIYEAANWFVCREDYLAAIETLAPWIFNVYVQNHTLNESGADVVETWKFGQVGLDHIGIWDSGGVDGDAVFSKLREVGYEGYVTVHQAFGGVMAPVDAARRTFEYLQPRVT